MRRTTFIFFGLLFSIALSAQIGPASSGSCSVAPSGAEGCSWWSGLPVRAGSETRKSPLFVTQYRLAPGAPLRAPVPGYDNLIVGKTSGTLLNESRTPPVRVAVFNGSVVLMPKEQAYLLRNIGEDYVDLLVIEIRK